MRSLPLTSALFPSETKVEIPGPVRMAFSSRAMPTAPDCDATASPPGGGGAGGEAGVEPHARIGVDHAEAVGSDQADAVGASQPEHLLLAANAVRSGFTEPGTENDGAPDARAARVGEDARHLVSGHRDDQQVDRPGQLLDRAVAGDIVDVGTGAVDRVQIAGEAVVAQREQGLAADAAGPTASADHRDRGGREQGAQ
nr:hypothetical protein GCM10020092_080210 [Actinoplanes digitatis]